MAEPETKLEEVEVVPWKNTGSLCEIYQPTGILFAFVSPKEDGSKQCHPWVKCRDFLHDALRNQISRKTDSIYGFNYAVGTNPPLDLRKMRMLFKRTPPKKEDNESKRTEEIVNSALTIIQFMEDQAGIKPFTKLYTVAKQKDIYLFEGEPDWMESTFMISLFTFLIRLGAKNIEFKTKEEFDAKLNDLVKKGEAGIGDHDTSYLKIVYPFLYKIILNRKALSYVREDGTHFMNKQSITIFHNYTGIVTLCGEAGGKSRTGVPEMTELAKCIIEPKEKGVKKCKSTATKSEKL
jgi:hypothetical protein